MTGELADREIDALLRSSITARIGCTLPDGVAYVVPVSYAYDGSSLYSYAAEGLKLSAMRAHPLVCVEVDRLEDASNWSSAIAWAPFSSLRLAERVTRIETFRPADAVRARELIGRPSPRFSPRRRPRLTAQDVCTARRIAFAASTFWYACSIVEPMRSSKSLPHATAIVCPIVRSKAIPAVPRGGS